MSTHSTLCYCCNALVLPADYNIQCCSDCGIKIKHRLGVDAIMDTIISTIGLHYGISKEDIFDSSHRPKPVMGRVLMFSFMKQFMQYKSNEVAKHISARLNSGNKISGSTIRYKRTVLLSNYKHDSSYQAEYDAASVFLINILAKSVNITPINKEIGMIPDQEICDAINEIAPLITSDQKSSLSKAINKIINRRYVLMQFITDPTRIYNDNKSGQVQVEVGSPLQREILLSCINS